MRAVGVGQNYRLQDIQLFEIRDSEGSLRLSGTIGGVCNARHDMPRPRRRTPGTRIPVKYRSHFAGGHRIRVTPVPIPNTEVKPDTADGTARETVWESRSLPALFRSKKPGR